MIRLAAVGPSADDSSAALFADELAIRRLISELRGLERGSWRVDLAGPPIAETPLRRLILRTAEAPLRVEVEASGLVIRGRPSALGRLADELEEYVEHNDLDRPGMHTHVDPSDWSDEDWLDPDSTPLMVAGWVPDGPG